MLFKKGHKVSNEIRQKISQTLKGHKVSEETREKISRKGMGKRIGKDNGNWKGGIIENTNYKMILNLEHPHRNKKNYVMEHRLVMEKHLGRYLKPKEIVHHIDGNRKNNNLKNLMLFSNDSEHQIYHQQLKREIA